MSLDAALGFCLLFAWLAGMYIAVTATYWRNR